MTTAKLTSAPDTPLTFDGEMTIYTAADLFHTLQQHLTTQRTLIINLSAVTEMDSAGLQLLLIAHSEAIRRGIPFLLQAYSPAVQDVLRLLHLEQSLTHPASTASGGVDNHS